MIATIKYKGIQLDVVGHYQKSVPAPTYDTQPIIESFEAEKVLLHDVDVTDLVDLLGIDWKEVERITLEQVKD